MRFSDVLYFYKIQYQTSRESLGLFSCQNLVKSNAYLSFKTRITPLTKLMFYLRFVAINIDIM